jgi:nucleoside phosphorylase
MNIDAVKGQVDFGILTVRQDELHAVLDKFPDKLDDGLASGRRRYNMRTLDLGDGDAYVIAVVRCHEQGNGEALATARDLLEELSPRWLLVVGIAGGAPAFEFTLGDVVVSTRIVDFSVEALLKDGSYEHAVTGGAVPQEAASLAVNLTAELGAWNTPDLVGWERPVFDLSHARFYGEDDWQKRVHETLVFHSKRPVPAPLVTAGALASSDRLVKDAERMQAWLRMARQVLAVEMESGGVHRAVYGREVPFLAIRGISDVIGLERQHEWIGYACNTAAALARALLLMRPTMSQKRARAVIEQIMKPVRGSEEATVDIRQLMQNVKDAQQRDKYLGAALLGFLAGISCCSVCSPSDRTRARADTHTPSPGPSSGGATAPSSVPVAIGAGAASASPPRATNSGTR